MKTTGLALLVGFAGYILGVLLGMAAVNMFSTNQHDKSVEAAMTGFFFFGPALSILSVVVFLLIRFLR
ncbi:MAG TPA: hypothetical protein VLD57_02310 [Blastocatellia bacterium]|nr:hypothetical protein [Blastocatellia bacterium]